MRGSKPGERRGGRQKGTPNKVSGDIRAIVLEALIRAGGPGYLLAQASENPGPFMALVGKIVPRENVHSGDPENPIKHEHSVELKKAQAKAIFDSVFGEPENGGS